MDQLDLLKKDWKKQEATLPKYSQSELSKLIHKKSSSIVKWIFIISLLEITLPHLVYLFIDYDDLNKVYGKVSMGNILWILYGFAYIVVFYFIYEFYKNYKSISANSTTKELMKNIIKTRRTVKHYIWFNLSMIPIIGGITLYYYFKSPYFNEQLPENVSTGVLFFVAFIIILIVALIFWMFYQLIYGFLLRKLKLNYQELIKDGNGNL